MGSGFQEHRNETCGDTKFGFDRDFLYKDERENTNGVPPCTLIIKESICPLLEFLSDCLGFLVPLKPSLILLVESPALIFECFGSKVLLVRSLLVVEDI